MFIISEKKRGRPRQFDNENQNSQLEQKKQQLFNSDQGKSEYVNLINLAYQTCKLNKKEFDLGLFLEKQYNLSLQYLELKTIPKNSPHTWSNKLKMEANLRNSEQAFKTLEKIKILLAQHAPKIATEFFKLINTHHSYEELLILKMNPQIMQILKDGLKTLNVLIDLGYL